MLHNPCGVWYGAGVYFDSSVDLFYSVGIKKKNFVWGSVCAAWYQYKGGYVKYLHVSAC